MKTLTIKNPWAWLIMRGGKNVENRAWRSNYRGRILIHASQKHQDIKIDPSCISCDEIDFLSALGEAEEYDGCILGTVELVDCVQNAKSPWAERGLWHWVLKNPIPLEEPIPAKGKLGLWDYEANSELP